MKAVRVHEFGSPAVLKLEELPKLTPEAGQVVVRTQAIGVNPVDGFLCSGYLPNLPLPFTPGVDAAGFVESIGAGVTSVKVGDRVYGGWSLSGTYAEQVLYNAAQVFPLPDNVLFSQGAGVMMTYFTAHYALFARGFGVPGETVLVHGASGGVGTATVQMAKAAGFKVIGTASTERGRALVKREGADYVFDHSSADYVQQILDLTQGRGVDLILAMKSGYTLAKDMQMVADYGRIVLVGGKEVSDGKQVGIEIEPDTLLFKNTDILGLYINKAPEADLARAKEDIFRGLQNGTLRPIVDMELPLTEVQQAHRLIEHRRGAAGKIILIP